MLFKKQSKTKVNLNKVQMKLAKTENHLSLLSPNKIFRSRFKKAKQCLDGMATDAKYRLNFKLCSFHHKPHFEFLFMHIFYKCEHLFNSNVV